MHKDLLKNILDIYKIFLIKSDAYTFLCLWFDYALLLEWKRNWKFII